jgi:hypothetical protein
MQVLNFHSMITIKLKRSVSRAFENALAIGSGLLHFDEIMVSDERKWQLNIRSRKQLEDAIQFIAVCERLKHKNVYLDGIEQPWNATFGFLKCFLTKQELELDWKYCHGIYDGANNLWGCHTLGGWQYGKHGRWDGKQWIFNKRAIQRDALSKSKDCEHCPAYDKNRIVAIVNALPVSVNPVVDSNWCFLQSPVGPDDPIHKVEIARRNCTEIIYSSGVGMTASAIEPIMEMNRSLARKIPLRVAEWVVINGNLDHELITPSLYEKRKKNQSRRTTSTVRTN